MSISLYIPKDIHLPLSESFMLSVKQDNLSVVEACNSYICADLPAHICHLSLALVFL